MAKFPTRKLFLDVVRALRAAGQLEVAKAAGMASDTLSRNTDSRIGFRADGARITFDWPYYWAAYLHDGRGPVSAKRATHLIYFRDPDDDPRIGGAARLYPRRKSEIRKLSKAEFLYWQQQNALAPRGQEPMIVRRNVGPSRAFPFLEVPHSPLRAFERTGANLAAEEATREFTALLEAEVSFSTRLDIRL